MAVDSKSPCAQTVAMISSSSVQTSGAFSSSGTFSWRTFAVTTPDLKFASYPTARTISSSPCATPNVMTLTKLSVPSIEILSFSGSSSSWRIVNSLPGIKAVTMRLMLAPRTLERGPTNGPLMPPLLRMMYPISSFSPSSSSARAATRAFNMAGSEPARAGRALSAAGWRCMQVVKQSQTAFADSSATLTPHTPSADAPAVWHRLTRSLGSHHRPTVAKHGHSFLCTITSSAQKILQLPSPLRPAQDSRVIITGARQRSAATPCV